MILARFLMPGCAREQLGVVNAEKTMVRPLGPAEAMNIWEVPAKAALDAADTADTAEAASTANAPGAQGVTGAAEAKAETKTLPLSEVTLLSPIAHPEQDIICLGVNYMDHAAESARYKHEDFDGRREYPVYFSKRVGATSGICGPSGIINGHFDIQSCLDYEVELALIIGKDASCVPEDKACDYVFGYSVFNDISSRDLQTRHKQFYFAKSLDSFACMGPWIVTADEFSFPPALSITSRVNGELRQNSSTANMIFNIPYIIHELSCGMTLKAGTIIATGTPSGVGMGFDPPRWLKPGDVVECEIEGIGVLRNTVG